MSFYRKIFSLLVLSAPLINFSFLPGSNLPLFYLIGLAGIAVMLAYNHGVDVKIFGVEDVFFCGFILIAGASVVVNADSYPVAPGVSQIINHILTYGLFKFALALLFKTRPDPDHLLRRIFLINTYWQIPSIVIFFVGVVNPHWLIAFLGFINNSGNFNVGAIGESLETARSFGFAPEPSFWSFFIAVNLAIALIIPRPSALLLSINFLNLLLTVGRTGFLIATCILVIRFAKSSPLFKVVLVTGAGIALFLGFEYLDLRQLQQVDSSFDQRIDSLFVALEVAASNPLVGIGLGNFRLYAETANLNYADIFNLYLSQLVAVGIPGLACYVGMLYFTFLRTQARYNLPFYAAAIGWLTVSAYNLPFVWIVFSIVVYTSEYRAQSGIPALRPTE